MKFQPVNHIAIKIFDLSHYHSKFKKSLQKIEFNEMWVKSNIIKREMGLSNHALNKKRYRSIWIEGVHWIKAKDNVIYYNINEIQRWVYE